MERLAENVAYKLDGWTSGQILRLAGYAKFNLPPSPAFLKNISSLTTLLPPQELTPLTVERLSGMVPRAKDHAKWPED